MNRKIFSLLIALVLIGSNYNSASAQLIQKIKGSNKYTNTILKAPKFKSIKVYLGAVVTYQQSADSAGYIDIYSEDNIVEYIKAGVEGGVLVIDSKSSFKSLDYGTIRIKVYSDVLEKVDINGSGVFYMENPFTAKELKLLLNGSGSIEFADLNCEKLSISVSGSGDIKLTEGYTKEAEINITGSAEVRAHEFAMDLLKSRISGSGSINCTVNKRIDSTIFGSGSIVYQGEPSVKTSTYGSGTVLQAKKK